MAVGFRVGLRAIFLACLGCLGIQPALDQLVNLTHRTSRVAEEMGGPDAVELPALGFVNAGAEDVPFDGIFGTGEASHVAEDADGHILGTLGMEHSQVDSKAVVAPMYFAGLIVTG